MNERDSHDFDFMTDTDLDEANFSAEEPPSFPSPFFDLEPDEAREAAYRRQAALGFALDHYRERMSVEPADVVKAAKLFDEFLAGEDANRS